MKREIRALIAGLTAAAAAAGTAYIIQVYQSGQGFHPFQSDREMRNDQILFPDSDSASGLREDGSAGDDSFWQEEGADDGTTPTGAQSAYLFSQDQPAPEGVPSGSVTTPSAPGDPQMEGTLPSGGNVYEITEGDGDDSTDLVLPGSLSGGTVSGEGTGSGEEELPGGLHPGTGGSGSGSSSGSGSHGGSSGGSSSGKNDPSSGGSSGGSNGGSTTPDGPTPGQVVTPDPTPGYGSASKDEPSADYVPPTYAGSRDEHFSASTSGKLQDSTGGYEVRFTAPFSPNQYAGEALYRGQTGVDQKTLFQSMEAFVWERDSDVNYYWTLDDLAQGEDDGYVKITGVSLDPFGLEKITEFPISIPEDQYSMTIFLSYRLSLDDPWTEYTSVGIFGDEAPGVSYTLMDGRVVVLDSILESEGQVISKDHILNTYSQYLDSWTDSLNLLQYQNKLLGERGTRLSTLFPGWKEDGELVPFSYGVASGRHVLEPAGQVTLSEDYQVEITGMWMTADYTVPANDQVVSNAVYVYPQTLTCYLGADKINDWVERLTVPQYVQAVQFPYYHGLTVDTLELPETVLYVDTSGIPSIDEDWLLYDRGLKVTQNYTVAEGNPRYSSRDGLLLNVDGTEILGVPTARTALTVQSGVTRVVLPYSNSLKALVLEAESLEDLPEVNYARLSKSCRIVVPDELLTAYLSDQREMLQRTGLSVIPSSQYDPSQDGSQNGYVLRDDFLLTSDLRLHQVLRESVHWLALPDGLTGAEAEAFTSLAGDLEVLILPQDGTFPHFAEGSFAGYDKLTLACYTEDQATAAGSLAALYPDVIRVRMVESHGDYTYLESDGGYVLLSVPQGLVTFDGTFSTEHGKETAAVLGDRLFDNSDTLRWVILPQETRAVGYQTFRNCWSLEGVLIDRRDTFLLSKNAFEDSSALRFVASNAQNMILEDPEFGLFSNDVSQEYSFLYCLGDNSGYNGNWTSLLDADHYVLTDCGGTKVLYAATESGTPFAALRSGGRVQGDVTLPSTTTVIFRGAFMDAKGSGDAAFTLNWGELSRLVELWNESFAKSDVGADLTLPADLKIQSRAFAECPKLQSITLPGHRTVDTWGNRSGGVDLGNEVFYSCRSLTTVRIGEMRAEAGIFHSAFSGSALQNLILEDTEPPKLIYYAQGADFYFEYDQEAAGTLRITVPAGSEEDYVRAWRCNMVGYVAENGRTAFQSMWEGTADKLFFDLWREPTVAEIREAVDTRLLAAENRTRALLGLDPVEALEWNYTYTVDEGGYITLTGVGDIGADTDLSAATVDLPYAWCLDYIAADAFRNAPQLRSVFVPEGLAAIHANAFRGVTFDESDETDGLILYLNSLDDIFALIPEGEGVPFTFGVEDGRIRVLSWDAAMGDEEAMAAFVQLWTVPMAGYSDLDVLEAAVRAQLGEDATVAQVRAAMEDILLPAENRVRTLLEYVDGTDRLTFTFTLEGEGNDLPDTDPNLPDLPPAPPQGTDGSGDEEGDGTDGTSGSDGGDGSNGNDTGSAGNDSGNTETEGETAQ